MPNQNIIFIDGAVIDYQSLIAGIQAGTNVVILDSNQDGVKQITQALQGGEYQSVQIFSHGSSQSIQLGSTQLNANNLDYYSNQLQQWKNYLTQDADILLYGCSVASLDLGFVQKLSQITGADVAASDDITGNAELGGDWDLEVKIGEIESDLALTPEVTNAYTSILASNTAPTLNNTGNPRLAAIAQDITDTNNSGTLISVILARGADGNPITDPDIGAVEGIAVIGVDNTNGTWQYSINDGGNWINFAVSDTSATLLRDTAKIRFVPNPGYKGTAEFAFRAWDTSDGNISGTTNVDPGVGGGTSAYSINAEIASISIIHNTYDVGLRPYSIVVGDFDKDGKTDLVTANKSSQTVSVLLGNGDGTFKSAKTFSIVGFNGLSPSSVVVGDFNKDGKLDLVTANNLSNNISLLLGKGDGSFQTAVNFALESASAPISIAVGDFNKDGISDIVTVNNASQNISVLLGNGAGSFGTASNFKVPSRPTSVSVADFNKDGISDLAVTSSYFNNVSIMLGDGDGTFSSATQFDVGTNPNSVVVGDFNKDNKLDLAVANSDSNNVSILLGNGASGFGIATNFDVGLNPASVTVIDFDNDGNSDLAVANAGSDTVSVLLGDGNGGFGIATNFVVGTKPYSLTVGDFNKDGKSELAVANSESKNVSLVNAEDETYEPVPPQPILINEILFDPPSTDSPKEYIELRGTPGAILAPGTFLVGIEGDSGTNAGNVQDIFDLSGKQFGSNGLLVLLQKGNSYAVNPNANVVTNTGTGAGWGNAASSSLGHIGGATDIENGSVSFFLIQTTTAPNLSNDIDSNNDGIADGAAYSNWTVLDSVSVLDGATTDIAYGSIVFRKGSVGSVPTNTTVVDTSFIAGYVGRSGNSTGSAASDWVASVTTGTAPDLFLSNTTSTSPGSFAGQPLNHIGDINFAPPTDINYAISTATPTVTEGNSGSQTVTFTVTRSGNTAVASTVNYALDGTATFSSDYNTIKVAGVTGAVSGVLIFAAGETTKAITLNVLGEKVTELDETINLTLSHPNQPTPVTNPGTVTIVNDDAPPAISFVANKSDSEDSGSLIFSVKLSNPSVDIITVDYTTANDTAIANVDYTPVTGTLTFNPGVISQTITVPILNDFVDEPTNSERFFINLTNPTNATIADNQGIGTITDDDTAGITISPANALVTTEAGGTANFSIQLDSQPTADVTINLSSSNVNEGTVSVSSVTFTAANWNTPQTIMVTGVDDGVADDNITYKIITAKAVSSDAKYNNIINPDDIDVVNIKSGNQVNSIITGTSKNDNPLQGTSSDDLIFGFAGNDVIVGGGGNDRIYGGLGTDNLTGGTGNDIFVIVQGEGRDTIKDFNLNEDLIALSSGISYSNLSITQSNNDTLIKIGTVSLALLTGITASNLNANHFTTY